MKRFTRYSLLLGTTLFLGCTESAPIEPATPPDSQPTAAASDADAEVESAPAVELTDGIYLVDDYDPERDAAADLQAAISAAEAANKRILLEVGGQW